MKRLTYEGDFCRDIALCNPGESRCGKEGCCRKRLWDRLKEYEDTGLSPEEIRIMAEERRKKV